MDLAKMLAMLDIIDHWPGGLPHLAADRVRALLSYPLQIDAARAHLAASVYVQMPCSRTSCIVSAIPKPIMPPPAGDVIESCQLARRRDRECAAGGAPDLTADSPRASSPR